MSYSIRSETLVLGMGNQILRDDAIGLLIVDEVQKQFNHPSVSFKTTNLSGVFLLDVISNYDSLIIIDAIQHGGKPGEMFWLTPDDFSRKNSAYNSQHKVGILQALQLGEALNQSVPRYVHILAIEVKDITNFGEGLTPEVREALPSAVEEVLHFLKNKVLSVPRFF